jgi:hypothetical protein
MMRRALIGLCVALPAALKAQTDSAQRAGLTRDSTPARAALGPPVRKISTASAISTE